MLKVLIQHADKVKYLLNENSVTLLTAAGVGGTVVTAVLTGRATFKAAGVIEHAKEEYSRDEGQKVYNPTTGVTLEETSSPVHLSKATKIKLIWPYYLPPAAAGILTITCIIVANRISAQKIAALTIAGGISERALQEYKEKVVEKLGDRQDQKIRDEIAQDRVNAHPPGSEVVLAGTGQVLCYDMTTGRYFQSTMEDIKRAENKINYELNNHLYASLAEFHNEVGLPATTYTDQVGWNSSQGMVAVKFSSVISPDNRPCLAIDFERPPFLEYSAMHQ